MKYGMRERVSGALILIALAIIFVPLLFDEPAPREERPQPVLTIEQPVEVERPELSDPAPPASLSEAQTESSEASVATDEPETPIQADAESEAEDVATTSGNREEASSKPQEDPIAELAQSADQRQSQATPGGDWAVQVGSFGEPGNAERLQARLEEQGYPAYRRERSNNLTTVYVGPYATSEQAESSMGKLKASLNLQGLLVRAK